MNKATEAMAKAIYAQRIWWLVHRGMISPTWEEVDDAMKVELLAEARAALGALRDTELSDSALEAWEAETNIPAAWRAMIEAVLAGTP